MCLKWGHEVGNVASIQLQIRGITSTFIWQSSHSKEKHTNISYLFFNCVSFISAVECRTIFHLPRKYSINKIDLLFNGWKIPDISLKTVGNLRWWWCSFYHFWLCFPLETFWKEKKTNKISYSLFFHLTWAASIERKNKKYVALKLQSSVGRLPTCLHCQLPFPQFFLMEKNSIEEEIQSINIFFFHFHSLVNKSSGGGTSSRPKNLFSPCPQQKRDGSVI